MKLHVLKTSNYVRVNRYKQKYNRGVIITVWVKILPKKGYVKKVNTKIQNKNQEIE